VLVLTDKYYGGIVPEPAERTESDQAMLSELSQASERIGERLANYKFRDALQECMNLARSGNKYLADEEPWKVVKTDPIRVQTIMYTAIQVLGGLAQLLEPFLPDTAKALRGSHNATLMNWTELGREEFLPAGATLSKIDLLFQKIEDEAMDAQRLKLQTERS
jgi:methionyl-tRNA synthetase